MPIPPKEPVLDEPEEDEDLDGDEEDDEGDDEGDDDADDDDEDEDAETTADDVAEDIVEAMRAACDHCSAIAADGKKVILDMGDGSKWLVTVRSRQ